MTDNSRRPTSTRRLLLILLAALLLILLLVLGRCMLRPRAAPSPTPPAQPALLPTPPAPGPSSTPAAAAPEVLTPATLAGPAQVTAGAEFQVSWTGPNNPGDYITIALVGVDAPGHYALTQQGPTLTLIAPIEPGPVDAAKPTHELRYVTGRSRTVLARAPIAVLPAGATITAPPSAAAGAEFQVSWTGPNNPGDYITIALKAWPDDKYGNYANTAAGSPLTLTALPDAGDAELRYVSGQGRKVLARRALTLVTPTASLEAPDSAVAGSTIAVAWTGPNAAGDYVTIVEKSEPDDKFGNYTNTAAGSPLKLLTPILSGPVELRYIMGQGRRVLARKTITLSPPAVTLAAPDECAPGASVAITWTGPNFAGDYLTIVPAAAPDSKFGAYTNTSAGSPLRVAAPKEPGDAEIRYLTGQGGKVLARRPIRVKH